MVSDLGGAAAEISDDSELFPRRCTWQVPCLAQNDSGVRSKGNGAQIGGVTQEYKNNADLYDSDGPEELPPKASDREACVLDTGCFPGLQGRSFG